MRKAFRRAVLAGIVAGIVYAIWRAVQSRIPAPAGDLDWDTAPFPFPPAPRPATASGPTPAAPASTAPLGTPDATDVAVDNDAAGTATGSDSAANGAWVAPVDGACPSSHPVKAKLSSGIFHVPGGQNYERTKPDRCYRDDDAAIADGLRKSQR